MHHMLPWNINIFQTAEWKGFLVRGCLPKGGKWMDIWELNELSGRKCIVSASYQPNKATRFMKIQVSNFFLLMWNLYLTIDLTTKNKFIVCGKRECLHLWSELSVTYENWNISYNCAIQRFSRNKWMLVNRHSDLGQRLKTAVTVLTYWLWLIFFSFVHLIPDIPVEVILFQKLLSNFRFYRVSELYF